MNFQPAQVIENMWVAWSRRDKAAALAYYAPDVRFALHIPQEVMPFGGGPTIGRAAMSDRLQTILDAFDTVRYVGSVTGCEGQEVRGNVDYIFRHKLTGEAIEGVMRHVARVENGLITSFDEYHDVERIRAFMRLVSQTAAR